MAAPTPKWARAGSRTHGSDDEPVPHLLGALHDRFGGQANMAVLSADGDAHHYAGNSENPVFAFRLGRIGVVSTGIYSLDRSLFRYVAPGRDRTTPGAAAHDGQRWTVTESRGRVVGCEPAHRAGARTRWTCPSRLTSSVPSEREPVRGRGRRPTTASLPMASCSGCRSTGSASRSSAGSVSSSRNLPSSLLADEGRCRPRRSFLALSGAIIAVARPADGRLDQRLHVSRWGRRKPYILIGILLDLVFLVGIATCNTLFTIAASRPAPAVQLELRPGPVPGLRAGPRAGRRRSASPARWSGLCRSSGVVDRASRRHHRARGTGTSRSRPSRSASSSS